MPAIRYGIAGRPVAHSLSPLLTALVARHLGIALNDKQLTMELVDVDNIPDALAWGYAGAVPEPIPWAYTNAVFGKFRTKALIKKSLVGGRRTHRSDRASISLAITHTDVR